MTAYAYSDHTRHMRTKLRRKSFFIRYLDTV